MCVERRLVELTRQLLEERQRSRQDRLNLAKLQQELARQKSEHPLVSLYYYLSQTPSYIHTQREFVKHRKTNMSLCAKRDNTA